ncbi:MAG: [protein-PII] uridylyltransferase, partial [Burkholderiaceae bacterium]|nr:[protein-PII] uridylyltransferase [Burkholderiaceae bacterium]
MSAAIAVSPQNALQTLRADYRQRKTALLTALRDDIVPARSTRPALARLARLTDGALRALWRACGMDERLALAAVGGYGRGELFPYSDVDVLLLLPPDAAPAADAALRQRIEDFISRCWDLGLDLGSSVRTVEECLIQAAQDITVQTALLEARQVTGDRALFQDLRARFAARLDSLDFFNAKQMEMHQRHLKYEDSPYALEPNCKESPGGLRDLHIIGWLTRAAGIGHRWDDLARAGLATMREVRELRHNEALLAHIRARLHLAAGRREDRLIFDLQTAVAQGLGLVDRVDSQGRVVERASELLMRRYYWSAKAITQLNQILLQGIEEHLRAAHGQALPAPRRIDERFFDRDGLLDIARNDLYQTDRRAIMATFLVYAQTPGLRGLSMRTLRAFYNARALMDHAFRSNAANHRAFIEFLQQPQGIVHGLRLMNQTSVLGRYLWPFRRVVGQMQHDLFHVYTVDQHILMVVRNMRRFFMPEHAHEYPFCSQLAAGWDQPWLLYVAALFHDIAKGRGGDHCALGALEARRFCRHHGLAAQDAKLIEFLVRHHLEMSRVAQKEDISDPDVIRAFARLVGSERNLTALYLLTVADIRGTSPKVWSAWKGKLLQDLYQITARALGGHAPDANALIEARKREALALLARAGDAQDPRALWATLEAGYFQRHAPDEIAWHARMLPHGVTPQPQCANASPASGAAGRKQASGTCVRARRSPIGEGLQVLVYTADRRDLFARICGYFDRAGFSILDARIHNTRDGRALDTFQAVRSDQAGDEREIIGQMEAELPQAIESQMPLPAQRLG